MTALDDVLTAYALADEIVADKEDTCEMAEKELASLRRDAARYGWLRAFGLKGIDLDHAVDAAVLD